MLIHIYMNYNIYIVILLNLNQVYEHLLSLLSDSVVTRRVKLSSLLIKKNRKINGCLKRKLCVIHKNPI